MNKPISFRLALAQLNPVMGDVHGNFACAVDALAKAAHERADLLVFPELFMCGYPPEDLVYRKDFTQLCMDKTLELAKLAANTGVDILMGLPWLAQDVQGSRAIAYNSAALLVGGEIVAVRYKHHLPNNGVFDEMRTFLSGPLPQPISWRGIELGVAICEDIWKRDVCAHLAQNGAQVLLVMNGSPFENDKAKKRLDVVRARVQETSLPLIYLNMVGGQDELVFDGGSFILNQSLNIAFQAPEFEEVISFIDYPLDDLQSRPTAQNDDLKWERMYRACVLGVKDYVRKSGFCRVLLGLSGGVDSALVAVMAVDALGADNVSCYMLPSQYTAAISLEDAQALATALGCHYENIDIEPSVLAHRNALANAFAGKAADITEENLQSRVRGTLLMALSNKFGALLLTTGNKSEMATGFATLYGDMNGAFNPIKDLYKTQVYELCRWRNAHLPTGVLGGVGAIIPNRILERAPSAELAPNQTDQDRLPPYDVLDALLEMVIEFDMSADDMIARGYLPEVVERVLNLLRISEYKRRQSAPGPKIGRRSFGRDWRVPLVNRFR